MESPAFQELDAVDKKRKEVYARYKAAYDKIKDSTDEAIKTTYAARNDYLRKSHDMINYDSKTRAAVKAAYEEAYKANPAAAAQINELEAIEKELDARGRELDAARNKYYSTMALGVGHVSYDMGVGGRRRRRTKKSKRSRRRTSRRS
jgi:hypothetical protein